MNQLKQEAKIAKALEMSQLAEEKAQQTSELADTIAQKYYQRLCKTIIAQNSSSK